VVAEGYPKLKMGNRLRSLRHGSEPSDGGSWQRCRRFAVHATIAEHYFEGASFPVGGAPSIAASIAPVIEAPGGQTVFSPEVHEILLTYS